MSCKIKYTPAEFIAIMAIGFVQGNLPPAIDKNGKPVYVIQRVSKDVVGSGCGATLVVQATANAEFMKQINSLTTHEACNIGGLSQRKIGMWDLIEFPLSPLEWCQCGQSRHHSWSCAYAEQTKHRVVQFFQDLQNCHDTGALWWHRATAVGGLNTAKASACFRNIVLFELRLVAAKYSIPWPEVDVAITMLSAPLAERVPAIKGLADLEPAAMAT